MVANAAGGDPSAVLRTLERRVASLEAALAKQTEIATALEESERRLRTLLDNAPDTISVMDLESRLVYLNRIDPPMRVEDALGHRISDFLKPDAATRFTETFRSVVATGRSGVVEFETLRDSQWETRLVPLEHAGRIDAVMGIGYEVTERRKAAAVMRQRDVQVRHAQKMEAVGQLTAGIAHNFNNLLAAIIPSIQLARRDGVAHARLEDAEHAANRAADLVRQLMVFARRQRSVAAPRVPLDVHELIRRTVSICRATFDRSIDLDVSSSACVPAILGEAGQLEQVLLNVCLNARDAVLSRGASERRIRIDFDVVGRDDGRNDAGEWVRIRISDNGPGIPEDIRTRIFEPFFTTKDVGQGSGLGLATAYAITRDHGGTIECDSRPGEGTTFTLLLPGTRDPAFARPMEKREAWGGRETVLVIDDERLVRSAVRSVLEPHGYTVREATDGPSGFELFQREREHIDLVLLDLSMPGISGEAVLAALLREMPAAKIVVCTACEPVSVPPGAVAVLKKPFELDELLRVIRAACDGGGTSAKTGST